MTSFRSQVLAIFYIYLALSIDPIAASRVKVTKASLQEGAKQVQKNEELVRELQKAMEETHHEHLFEQNATDQYIGESWATCGQRKKDFQRRSMKVNKLYMDAKQDGKVDVTEYGWIILKSRRLTLALSTAAKQGCEWVHNQTMDAESIGALQEIQNHTAKNMPCHKEAMDYIAAKSEPSGEDFQGALSILFSKDCKVAEPSGEDEDMSPEAAVAEEEKEEQGAMEAAEQLEKKAGGSKKDVVASLLERVSEHATQDSGDVEIILGGLLALFMGFVILTLVCAIVIVTYAVLTALILGTIWCTLKFMIHLILAILTLGHHKPQGMVQCAVGWTHWAGDFINYNLHTEMFRCFINVILAIAEAAHDERHRGPHQPQRGGKGRRDPIRRDHHDHY